MSKIEWLQYPQITTYYNNSESDRHLYFPEYTVKNSNDFPIYGECTCPSNCQTKDWCFVLVCNDLDCSSYACGILIG